MKYVKIKSIKKVTSEPIYHLTIKKNHNFFGNDLLLHNCDYYNNPDNEGNIGLPLKNTSDKIVTLMQGERIAQGIFEPFLESDNCNTEEERKGGFGSTDNL